MATVFEKISDRFRIDLAERFKALFKKSLGIDPDLGDNYPAKLTNEQITSATDLAAAIEEEAVIYLDKVEVIVTINGTRHIGRLNTKKVVEVEVEE